MTCIITRLARCTCKTEVVCRTHAADTTVIVLECIVPFVGCVGASKLQESAAHRNLTEVLRIEA